MNLFLVGHGFIIRTVPTITIPPGITLKFYCREDTEFDSVWEQDVTLGRALADGYRPTRGTGQWEITTLVSGQECCDHLLTRPGGMRTLKPLNEMVEIQTIVSRTSMVNDQLNNDDTLCIKGGAKQMAGGTSPGLPYAYLSDILLSIKNVTDEATVHWCACRSADTDRSDIGAQASSAWLGVLK
jgi:hypothetical protein